MIDIAVLTLQLVFSPNNSCYWLGLGWIPGMIDIAVLALQLVLALITHVTGLV